MKTYHFASKAGRERMQCMSTDVRKTSLILLFCHNILRGLSGRRLLFSSLALISQQPLKLPISVPSHLVEKRHTKLCKASLGTAGAAPGVVGAVGDNGPGFVVSLQSAPTLTRRYHTLRPSLANFSFSSSPVRPLPSISNIAFSTPGKFNPKPVLPIGPTTPPVVAFVVFVEVEDGRVRNDCLGSFVVSF